MEMKAKLFTNNKHHIPFTTWTTSQPTFISHPNRKRIPHSFIQVTITSSLPSCRTTENLAILLQLEETQSLNLSKVAAVVLTGMKPAVARLRPVVAGSALLLIMIAAHSTATRAIPYPVGVAVHPVFVIAELALAVHSSNNNKVTVAMIPNKIEFCKHTGTQSWHHTSARHRA